QPMLSLVALASVFASSLPSEEETRAKTQAAPSILTETLAQYPIEARRFWIYDTVEVMQEFGETSSATGQSTVTIIKVRDGKIGRLAITQDEFVLKNVSGSPRHSVVNHVLPWTFIVVPGNIYGSPTFNQELI